MTGLAELVIEILFSITFEFSFDILCSKRVRTWVKIPIFIIFLLVNLFLISIFIMLGLNQYSMDNLMLALVFFAITFIYVFLIYKAFRKKMSGSKG